MDARVRPDGSGSAVSEKFPQAVQAVLARSSGRKAVPEEGTEQERRNPLPSQEKSGGRGDFGRGTRLAEGERRTREQDRGRATRDQVSEGADARPVQGQGAH